MNKQNNTYKMTIVGCVLATLLLMPSCTDENEVFVKTSNLSITVNAESMKPTRSIIEGGTLPDESIIGLSLVDKDGSSYGESDYGIFTATASKNIVPQEWNLNKDVKLNAVEGTLYGFFPYNENVEDIKSIPVQAGDTDYMYAVPVTGLNYSNADAQITMKHALTAIKLSLSLDTYSGKGVVSTLTLSGNVAVSAKLDATTGVLLEYGNAEIDLLGGSTPTLTSTATTFSRMVIPTADTGELTVSVTLDGTSLTATLNDCDLTAGNLLNINATLNGKELIISSITLEDWQNTTSADLNNQVLENLLAVYNVTSTTEATPIVYATGGLAKMIIDGVELEPTTTYTFSSTGEHLVEFVLSNNYSIYNDFFEGCKNLTGIYIPNSVTSIGDYAFNGCTGLTAVTIPNSVTSIGSGAFSGCTGLTDVVLGSGIQKIGDGAFNSCSYIQSIVVDEDNLYYDSRSNCNAIMETATNTLIHGCNNTVIPENCLSIGDYAFNGCTGLTAVTIPNSVTSIGPGAFLECSSLRVFKLSDNVTVIGRDAFRDCKGLTAVTIPNSVTTIGMSAFYGCDELTALDLGTSVQIIGISGFGGCSELISIISRATTAPTIGSNTFLAVKSRGTLIVPTGATGYDTWMSTSSGYLGYYNWTMQEDFTPTECVSLSITADDVDGRSTSTLIHYNAVCNGVNNLTGEMENNVTIARTVTSDEFTQNPSTTESRQVTVSFTYLGKTATTTITQSPYVEAYYTVDLNDQWQSSSKANPDATLYDGVYESFSNYNVHNSGATMTIKVLGYTSFTIYIRSYAESIFDYVMASALDQTIDYSSSYSNATLVKAHTCDSQNSGTDIGSYKVVTYDIPDDGAEHTITIVYRKDGSSNSGDDRGYVLIGKP